jgi:hypothetical protein
VKLFSNAPEAMKGKYSPAECIGTRKTRIKGDPDAARHEPTLLALGQKL